MRMPPLNALRAFEAAARHGSFAHAGEELHVSPGAISRHVKLLEEHLQVTLFRRLPRGLELTPAAHRLLPRITASFEMIKEAARELSTETSVLKVIAPPTLAHRWLVPRLGRFRERQPRIQVSVGILHASYDEFYRGGFDVGISCSEVDRKRPADLDGALVRLEKLTPVCAPSLLERVGALRCPEELRQHILLHPDPEPYDWRKWLERAGLAGVINFREGQTYETMELAARAAVEGLGVAIADLYLVREELAAGTLVAPFELRVSDDTGYFVFFRRSRRAEPAIIAFRDWVLAEAAADERDLAAAAPTLSRPPPAP
jgi:LysR family glycine cleavage system transcriptional activator